MSNRLRSIKASACAICGKGQELHIHHKDWNHHNNSPNNLLTLCQHCHTILHRFPYLADYEELDKLIIKVRAALPLLPTPFADDYTEYCHAEAREKRKLLRARLKAEAKNYKLTTQ